MDVQPGQSLTDLAVLQQLPTGSIISWYDEDDNPDSEVVALVERWETGDPVSLSHTAGRYWMSDPEDLIRPPYTVIRIGRTEP